MVCLVAVRGLGVGWVSDLFEVSPLSKQSFCPGVPNSGPRHGKTVKSEKRILPFTLLRFYAEKTILRFYAVTLLRTKNGFTLARLYGAGRVARFYVFTVLCFYAVTQQQAAGADGRARVKR